MAQKKKRVVSCSLSERAYKLQRTMSKGREHGWFSKFVSEALIERYGTNTRFQILNEELNKKTAQRNKIEEELQMISEEMIKERRKTEHGASEIQTNRAYSS